MASRDVAVVVDLDPTRLLVEAEQLGDTLEQAALGGVLRHPPVERRAGVLGRVVDQLALGAAHRPLQLDPAAGPDCQCRGQQCGVARGMAGQDQGRRRLVLVERVRSLKGEYFGPFASAGAVNRTLNALEFEVAAVWVEITSSETVCETMRRSLSGRRPGLV